MERMKIDSKTGYRKNRVKNGYGPHRILEMLYQTKLGKIVKEESHNRDSELNTKKEAISSRHKLTEVRK